jgi:hypothetical protein
VKIKQRLSVLAPLYSSVSGHGFGNLVGDALELAVYKCLLATHETNPQLTFLGQFALDAPKIGMRYKKTHPPKTLSGHATIKEFDFIQLGHVCGAIGIECKNYREWLYPHDSIIRDLILKSSSLHVLPLLIARRIQFSAKTNFLRPAGILFHESLFQYYPADQIELAERARDKRLLGFSDIDSSEQPRPFTLRFFRDALPKIVEPATTLWTTNREALVAYAREEISRQELYRAIGSPAAQPEAGEYDEHDEYW